MPDFRVEIRSRLAELQLSPVREAEIVEELSQHLEQEYERAVSGGASEEVARQEVLEQLNASDLLGRELKRVERRVSQRPVAPRCTIEDKSFWRSRPGRPLRAARAGEEPGVHIHRGDCARIGHRCK